jgi:nucleotide-binding universal stress UspA family protein
VHATIVWLVPFRLSLHTWSRGGPNELIAKAPLEVEMAQEQVGRRLVMVGVDGSSEAARALQWAIEEAREHDAEVVAVHALETQFLAYYSLEAGVPVQLEERWREEIQRVFEEDWCRPLKESGIRYRTLLLEGRPATVISEMADQLGAEMVVVGRRGRGGVERFLLGSVSSELTRDCPVPLVVLSAKGRESQAGAAEATPETP